MKIAISGKGGVRKTTLTALFAREAAARLEALIRREMEFASRGQAVITIGIKPAEPATGYGYIRVGEALPPPPGVKPYKTAFHRAEQFVEKPHFDRALEYVNSGQYRWNAGAGQQDRYAWITPRFISFGVSRDM